MTAGEPAAVNNIRFEPCQLLRQILAMLGRLAGTGSRRCIVVQALSSHGLHQRQAVQRVKRLVRRSGRGNHGIDPASVRRRWKTAPVLQESGLASETADDGRARAAQPHVPRRRADARQTTIHSPCAQRMQLQPVTSHPVRDQGHASMAARSCGSSFRLTFGDPRNGGEPAIVLCGSDARSHGLHRCCCGESASGRRHWLGLLPALGRGCSSICMW